METERGATACSTGALMRQARRRLDAAGVGSAALDASVLTAAVLGCDRTDLVRMERESVRDDQRNLLEVMMQRRLAGEPVSRIIGAREFWSLDFVLSPDTLDPRPDTETVIEACLEIVARDSLESTPFRFADLGTGSGCILVALLAEVPCAYGVGLDASVEAVKTARLNARAHAVEERAVFVCGDWANCLESGFTMMVSNPPYVASGEIGTLAPEVARFDPRRALDGGVEGLDAYKPIAEQASVRLVDGGWLVFEVGAGQDDAVEGIMEEAGFIADAMLPVRVRDLSGTVRCMRMRRPGS